MNRYGIKEQIFAELLAVFPTIPAIRKVLLFGSRARGDYRPDSDIDLAIEAECAWPGLQDHLDELPTILKFDVVELNHIANEKLRDNILREGEVIFERHAPDHRGAGC